MKKKLKITGCEDCMFFSSESEYPSWECSLANRSIHPRHSYTLPVETPEWCPLRNGGVEVTVSIPPYVEPPKGPDDREVTVEEVEMAFRFGATFRKL